MYKILIITILISSSLWAQRLHGHSMGSTIGLGGFLKRLVIPNSLPIGSLVGTAGHEVYDFSKYPEFKNKQAYCFHAIDFAADANLLGIYFGGEVSKVFTTGTCEMKPEALVGEDLMVFLSFDPGKGTKSIPIGMAFNFGFSMNNYVSMMENSFSRSFLSNRTSGERLKRLHIHIASYLAKKTIGASFTKSEKFFAKLLLYPFLAPFTESQKVVNLISPSSSELELLKNISTSGYKYSIKSQLESFFYKARRDASFYSCDSYNECEEIYVDFLNFYDILINSFDDCGSINIYAGALSEFSIKATSKLKFEIGFGYTRTEFNKAYNSSLPTSWQAIGQFAAHNFSSKSRACQELSEKVGSNFGRFLHFLK